MRICRVERAPFVEETCPPPARGERQGLLSVPSTSAQLPGRYQPALGHKPVLWASKGQTGSGCSSGGGRDCWAAVLHGEHLQVRDTRAAVWKTSPTAHGPEETAFQSCRGKTLMLHITRLSQSSLTCSAEILFSFPERCTYPLQKYAKKSQVFMVRSCMMTPVADTFASDGFCPGVCSACGSGLGWLGDTVRPFACDKLRENLSWLRGRQAGQSS